MLLISYFEAISLIFDSHDLFVRAISLALNRTSQNKGQRFRCAFKEVAHVASKKSGGFGWL